MAWFIGQSLVFIMLAFALGVITGRLYPRPAKKTTEQAREPILEIHDELEKIEGIGPAMANALRAAGIRTFDQLADSADEAKRDAIQAAGLSFAPSLATWGRQARLLADGDETAFEELTARLTAGRDTADHPATKPRPRPRPRPAPDGEETARTTKTAETIQTTEKPQTTGETGIDEKADAR